MAMKRTLTLLLMAVALTCWAQQTMWVCVGKVKYAYPTAAVGQMPYSNSTLTVLGKTFALSEVDSIYVDSEDFDDDNIQVTYDGSTAEVIVAGNIATHITASVNGAHVVVLQDTTVASEYIYTLQGSTTNGSFYNDGSYKMTLVMNGVTITNPDSAAVNIRNGKRIAIELVDGTTSTLEDGSDGSQKGCFAVKGHSEFKNGGTLNIKGNSNHAFWGKEYVELKKSTGTINILGAVGDGFNINQYFTMKGGTVTVTGVGDDALQVSYETDDNDVVVEDTENTGDVTISGGTVTITTTGAAAKGFKVAHDYIQSGGTVSVTQSGSLTSTTDDVSYVSAVKADNDINITGGSFTAYNTGDGGRGLNADGAINIDESSATTTVDITANGSGGTAENVSSDSGTSSSYKVYVTLPTGGQGGRPGQSSAWSKVYLYSSVGRLVQVLTMTWTKSSGASTLTFYYYDFQTADGGTYYFKGDDYTSSSGWGGSSTTYTIMSSTFTAPTSGTDVYYSISSSYTTSGTTRTYQLSNVTSSYGGTSDSSEDTGTSYNAAGIKADGNVTIGGGTITVSNSGAMSKSIKSKATVTVNDGSVTLTPSGSMMIINSDASYSSGIKAEDFVQNGGSIVINASGGAGKGISTNSTLVTNGGTLTVTNSGAGQTDSNGSTYTAKCLKADGNMSLNAGTITLSASGTGGKGIKVNGQYTQGTSDGSGPTLSVTTTGSALGSSSSSSGGMGGMGGTSSSSSSSSKGIKVMGSIYVYGGQTEIYTSTDGAEGLESKTDIYIEGGQHYVKSYDDCINASGCIYFNGGVTVCYSNGNDAVDSNAGRTGAITIGDGAVFAYTTKGSPEEGFDCDNNSYLESSGTNLGTYSFEPSRSSSLSILTATGMT